MTGRVSWHHGNIFSGKLHATHPLSSFRPGVPLSRLFMSLYDNRVGKANREGWFYLWLNNLLYVKSMANAPIGAVSTIASTATVSTVSPQANPKARGIPPIAA